MDAVTDSLEPYQKKQLHEVADGMVKIYRTLARMQYLLESCIQEGPHDMTPFLPVCERLGIDASIIYLFSILPYVDESYSGAGLDFFQGGRFVNFLDEGVIEDGRDPMFAEEEEELMRPWMTPLSFVGNHCTAILYDAREHAIGLYGQLDTGSCDENIHIEKWYRPLTEAITQEEDAEPRPWELLREDEDGEDDAPTDINNWDEMESRHAPYVLCDIAVWYESLAELPGGGEKSDAEEWHPEIIRRLYRNHSWPGPGFDGDAFLVDQARTCAAMSADEGLWRLLDHLRHLRRHPPNVSIPDMWADRVRLVSAQNPEEEWLVRWWLWHAEFRMSKHQEKLREAEDLVERLCPIGQCQKPDELLLRELEKLQDRRDSYRQAASGLRQEVEGVGGPGNATETLRLRWEYTEKRLATYERACNAYSSRDPLRNCEVEAEAIRGWLAQVPEGIQEAKKRAEEELQRREMDIESLKKRL
ncbi:hypothetical protein ACRALDRAFT_1071137 [Sodiomyces alcalophilus JCM 7366]|uniref:uncharacterized protein n=1 Tax=Sodiomyces alcalophilus JCM 7366 TaxID=591952 RepID=UPI0039B56D66